MDLRLEDFITVGTAAKNAIKRCSFIVGSDARIIMGPDEAPLIRLWRKGEVRLSLRTCRAI
jgi:hypothetical protein